MIGDIVLYLIGFWLFVILQAITINGIYECFRGSKLKDDINDKVDYQGMIFYMIAPKFFERNKHSYWSKPFYSCIKCMSSFWGAVTFWPLVVYYFGWQPIEVLIFIFDVFILITLNWIVYKKL